MTPRYRHHQIRSSEDEESSLPQSRGSYNINLEKRVGTIEGILGRIVEDMERLVRSQERLSDRLVNSQQTQWSPIISAIALAVTITLGIGAAVGSGWVRDVNRLESNQLEIAKKSFEHFISDGHPAVTKDIQLLRDRVNFIKGETDEGLRDLRNLLNERSSDRYYKQDQQEFNRTVILPLQQKVQELSEAYAQMK